MFAYSRCRNNKCEKMTFAGTGYCIEHLEDKEKINLEKLDIIRNGQIFEDQDFSGISFDNSIVLIIRNF